MERDGKGCDVWCGRDTGWGRRRPPTRAVCFVPGCGGVRRVWCGHKDAGVRRSGGGRGDPCVWGGRPVVRTRDGTGHAGGGVVVVRWTTVRVVRTAPPCERGVFFRGPCRAVVWGRCHAVVRGHCRAVFRGRRHARAVVRGRCHARAVVRGRCHARAVVRGHARAVVRGRCHVPGRALIWRVDVVAGPAFVWDAGAELWGSAPSRTVVVVRGAADELSGVQYAYASASASGDAGLWRIRGRGVFCDARCVGRVRRGGRDGRGVRAARGADGTGAAADAAAGAPADEHPG